MPVATGITDATTTPTWITRATVNPRDGRFVIQLPYVLSNEGFLVVGDIPEVEEEEEEERAE